MVKAIFRKPAPSRHWIVVGAALITVAAHGFLFGLIRYEPERRPAAAPKSAGVTLFNPAVLTAGERTGFNRWLSVHDPALMVRTDNEAGYAARHQLPVLHDFTGNRPVCTVELPERRIQKFRPLAPLAGTTKTRDLDFLFAGRQEPPPQTPAEPLRPIVRDAENRELHLSQLSFPVGRGAAGPTVVICRRAGSIVRQTLVESCGDEALDNTALMALSRSAGELPEFTTVTIYWPEPPAAPEEDQ